MENVLRARAINAILRIVNRVHISYRIISYVFIDDMVQNGNMVWCGGLGSAYTTHCNVCIHIQSMYWRIAVRLTESQTTGSK